MKSILNQPAKVAGKECLCHLVSDMRTKLSHREECRRFCQGPACTGELETDDIVDINGTARNGK